MLIRHSDASMLTGKVLATAKSDVLSELGNSGARVLWVFGAYGL